MSDINDVGRVGFVLEHPDGAFLHLKKDGTPDVSNIWKNADGTPAPRVVFYKDFDGTFYVTVATPDAKTKIVAIEDVFIGDEKIKESGGPVLGLAEMAHQTTPEARPDTSALFDTSITQSDEESNTKQRIATVS